MKKLLIGISTAALALALFVIPGFATQKTDLTNNQWRLLTVVELPTGYTNFMTSHPSYDENGATFTFPDINSGHMVYMLGNYNNDLTGKTITVKASWTPSTTYKTRSTCDSGDLAYGRLELQDTSSGTYNFNDYWWYNGQKFDLNNTDNSGTITALLSNRAAWTNICGKSATDTTVYSGPDCINGEYPAVSPYDGFTNAIKNVKQLGLSFGSSCRYASGVANDTPSTFTLSNFNIGE